MGKLFALLLFLLIMGCSDQERTYQERVTRYYRAFDAGSYSEIKGLIHDTITINSGDYSTSYSKDRFYQFFKWDSIFKPSYEVIAIHRSNEVVMATIGQKNIRNDFLGNNPLVFKVAISFANGNIAKIEELEYVEVDWGLWNRKKDSLVNWIGKNHPELNGFVNDLSMEGAKNYLEAIRKYRSKNPQNKKK